ncbi:MAG: flagellar motor switch protein FliN [Treponema sp.]|nr:flagellar motor switch protein FliN [Treponema sp.]MBQ5632110.1 flagellar motor switch protein FliN [Treponema sp.]MBQ5878016.1 flagellar motor switch protein FliN [Treponema sp.]
MSDGAISQDEIDALLSGVSVDGLDSSGHVMGGPTAHIDTTILQKFADSLKEPLVEKLNNMTGVSFDGGAAVVESLDRDGLLSKLPEVVVAVYADFSTTLQGDHLYILSPEFAQKLVNLITQEENADFDEMALSCISDFVSIHTNDEIMELDKTGKFPGLACNPPEAVNNPKAMIRVPQNIFALFSYTVSFDGQEYTLWEAIGGDAAEKIGNALGGGASSAPVNQGQPDVMAQPQMGMQMPMGGMPQMGMAQPQMGMQMPMGGMPQMGMAQPQMGMQMPMGGMPQMGMPMAQNMGMNVPNVQTLQYPNLQGSNLSGEQGNISLIMDVFMEMTVELGRTKKQIKDILGMGEGTIIELDKLAGEPVDILVNHKPIAKGEVVVIDENFGVRVTEILSPLERVSDLR